MASLIERDDHFYVQFYDKTRTPSRRRFSLQTKDQHEARKRIVWLEDAYRQGRFDPWTQDPWRFDQPSPEPLSLREASRRFLQAKKDAGRSENTLRTYREILSLLQDHLGGEDLDGEGITDRGAADKSAGEDSSGGLMLDAIRPESLRAFIREPHLSRATQHKRYGHLRTFFRWCKEKHYVHQSPLEAVVAPEKPQKLPKAVRPSDLDRICEAVREDYQEKLRGGHAREGELVWRIPLFRFAFYTGMRASELARLRWRHIDIERRLIIIRKQKNKKEQTIPLGKKAREVLEDVPEGDPDDYVFRSPSFEGTERSVRNFRERASKAFREARRRAGIKRELNFHSLRHGFCTALAEAGKSAVVIKEAARHADISTSMRYVHMANGRLKSEVDGAFGE